MSSHFYLLLTWLFINRHIQRIVWRLLTDGLINPENFSKPVKAPCLLKGRAMSTWLMVGFIIALLCQQQSWAGKKLSLKTQTISENCEADLNGDPPAESLENPKPIRNHNRRPYSAVSRSRQQWADKVDGIDLDASQTSLDEIHRNFIKKAFNLRTFRQSPLWSQLIQSFVQYLGHVARSESLASIEDAYSQNFTSYMLDQMIEKGRSQERYWSFRQFVEFFALEDSEPLSESQMISRISNVPAPVKKSELAVRIRLLKLLKEWIQFSQRQAIVQGLAWRDIGSIVDKNLKLILLIESVESKG